MTIVTSTMDLLIRCDLATLKFSLRIKLMLMMVMTLIWPLLERMIIEMITVKFVERQLVVAR